MYFCEGAHDERHLTTFRALDYDRLLGKIVLIHGSDGIAVDMLKFGLPRIRIDGLFMSPLSSVRATPPPISVTTTTNPEGTLTTTGGLVSPQSPPAAILHTPKGGHRLIDPTLVSATGFLACQSSDGLNEQPLHRQSPPVRGVRSWYTKPTC